MRKITRLIVKRFWGLCAVLLIGLAVVVTVGRELAPQVSRYQVDLETYLSEAWGVQVSIGAIAAGWQGLSPELELRQVRVTDGAEEILTIDTAYAELSLLRSLFNWELALGKVEVVNIAVGFRQNAEGIWTLSGLDPAGADLDINDPLDIFLLGHHIELRDAHFSFDFRTGHSSEVQLPHLLLENSGDFHRLTSEVAVDRNRDVLSLVIEARGDPRDLDKFTARGHLRLQRFELDKALAALPGEWWDGLPNQQWRKGHQLNLEAWFDIDAGMAITTRGRLDTGELPVNLQESVIAPKRTSANFAGHWAKSGAWKLAFRDVALEWDEVQAPELDLLLSSANLGEPVHLQTAQLDLAGWFAAVRAAGLLQGEAQQILEKLAPRGSLRNVKLSLTGTRLQDVTLRANLDDVAVGSWQGAPAVEQLDGYVETTPLSGHLDIASDRGFAMHYPTLHQNALTFDSARGRVRWKVDLEQETVNVHSGLLSVSSDAGEGRGYFSLFAPFKFGSQPEELIIQAGLRNSALSYHQRFVPYVLPESFLNWLNQSVGAGRVSDGGFVYRGGLTSEAVANAAIQLYLNVEQADLHFHPDWPALHQADGVFWLNDMTIVADVESARLLDAQVQEATVRVDIPMDGSGLMLDIAGRARGNASDGLRLVRETRLGEIVNRQLFADWQLDGDMQASIDLTIPLREEQRPMVRQVAVDLADTRLAMDDANLQFDQIEGHLSYSDEQGLRAERLTGQLWQNPVTASIEQVDSQQQGLDLLRFSMTGRADVGSLRQWSARPELQFFEGQAMYNASLTMPYQRLEEQASEAVALVVQSDLQGVAIDLPAPFGKTPEETRSLTFTAPLWGGGTEHTIVYDDVLHGVLTLQNGKLLAASFNVGSETNSSAASGLNVRGTLDRFDLSEWQAVLESYNRYQQGAGESATSMVNLSPRFDVHLKHFTWNELALADLHLEGRQTANHWQFTMDSPQIAGQARIYQDTRRPVLLDLDYLRLPALEQDVPAPRHPFLPPPEPSPPADFLADIDPADLPAIDFAVEDFAVGEENYGSWSFQVRPSHTGLVASEIVGNVRGGTIVGLQEGRGAELLWDKTEGEVLTRFNGRFVTENLGSVLQQWNQPRLLDSESSEFQARLNWPGSPAAIALTALQGDIIMEVEQGTFIRGAGEASTGSALLELIAFFNFDTWLRRLRLDFSDLSRAGTAFESMEGVLQFDQGKVYMNTPVVVNSHSSRFQMAGVVDLVNSELDTRLIATIPVGGNLTFVAALAGMGLPAVAGMWLISKVFEEQIGKMSSLSFDVTGPLEDPEMDFVRLFDDNAVSEVK